MGSTQRSITRPKAFPLTLLAIILLALILRVYGLHFGLPYMYKADEKATLHPAANMVATGDPNPHFFTYPSLYIYLQAIIRLLVKLFTTPWRDGLSPEQRHTIFVLAGRLLTAALGISTVFLTYLAGERLFNTRTGLVAASLLAVTFLHAQYSHYVTPDVPSAFFTMGCALFAARALHTDKRIDYLLAAMAAGLASGTKYNAGLVLILALLAYLLNRTRPREFFTLNLALIILVALLTFLVVTPYSLLDARTFLADMRGIMDHYTTGHPGFEGTDNWRYYIAYLFNEGLGIPLALTSALGFFYVISKHTKNDLFLLPFPLTYYLMLSAVPVRFVRNLMPILPFLALFGGRGLDSLFTWMEGKRPLRGGAIAALLTLLLVIHPTAKIVRYDHLLTQKDTRTSALEWVEEHIEPQSKIALEIHGPPLDHTKYVLATFWSLSDNELEWYRAQGFDYLVASSYMYSRFLEEEERYPREAAFYRRLFSQEVIAEFLGGDIVTPGPTIRIYWVP